MERLVCQACNYAVGFRPGCAGPAAEDMLAHLRKDHAGGSKLMYLAAGPADPVVQIEGYQVWRKRQDMGQARYLVIFGEYEPLRKERQKGLWITNPFNNTDGPEIMSEEQIRRNYEYLEKDYREHPELQEPCQ